MSIGNLKDQGNQGKNFPWQLKMLLGQQCACDELTAINANTDNLEYLLTAILTSLQASTDYEAKFVVDTCDSDKVYLEVRVWDTDSGTWGPITYYLPGSSTPVTPVGASTPGCLQYTDPSGVLGMILAELQLQTPILTAIEVDTSSIDTKLTSVVRTPNVLRATSSGTIAPLVYDFSVSNVGSSNGTILGATIKPGETLNFGAGALNNYYAAGTIAYNGTGTELVIIYNS